MKSKITCIDIVCACRRDAESPVRQQDSKGRSCFQLPFVLHSPGIPCQQCQSSACVAAMNVEYTPC